MTIETEIAEMLASKEATSNDIELLLTATDAAIAEGDATIIKTKELAMDPIATPDANKARSMVEGAIFANERLRSLRPRLAEKLIEAQVTEADARWTARYEKTKVVVDAAALRFQKYRELSAELAALMQDAAETDKLIGDLNATAPPNEHRRVYSVELTARGLKSFSRDNSEIGKELRLPAWDNSSQMLHPKHQPLDMSFYAPPPANIAHSADWWVPHQEAVAERALEEKQRALEDSEKRAFDWRPR